MKNSYTIKGMFIRQLPVSLKQLDAPCILYNLNGYYDDLKALLRRMIEKELSSEERQQGIYFAENLQQIKEILEK